MAIRYEKAMKSPVSKYLEDAGFHTRYELAVGHRRVDVVGWDPGRELLVTVELKIDKWLKALSQAMFYACWSDATFVAMPEDRARPALENLELFKSAGIGLLTIHRGVCTMQVEPMSRAIAPNDPYRKWALSLLTPGGGA